LKRALKYLILIAAFGAPAVILAGGGWLACSEAGSRKLLEAVSRFTPVKIKAETIEGNLADTLRLTNTIIEWPQGNIRIRQLKISMRPLEAPGGHLGISLLSADQVSVLDNSPKERPELVWPQAKGWITFVSGGIGHLAIRDLTYLRPDEQPVRIASLGASVGWKNSRLSISDLRINSSRGLLEGNILAGFHRPLLKANLAATLTRPAAGVDFIRLDGAFKPGRRPGEMNGSLQVDGLRNTRPILRMSSDLGMTPAGLSFSKIRLRRENRPGSVAGEGLLTFKGPTPCITMRIQAENVDLSDELKIPANLSGSLLFEGTGRQYQGRVTLANTADTRHSFRLAGDYSGDSESATLSRIQGTALGGSLNGRLEIRWTDGLRLNGAMSGKNLDPARWDPEWAGVIHFDLAGDVSAKAGEPASGALNLTLKESRLHGRQLTGDLRASFAGDDIDIHHLALRGKGFEISARGSIADQLDFKAEIRDLARLIPRASGALTASGWARRRHDRFSGVVSARGHSLSADGWSIASANFSAFLDDREKSPFSLTAAFSRLRFQTLTADTLTLRGGGTVLSHTLDAFTRRGPHEMHLGLTGAWRRKGWQGKIVRLEGRDGVGPWRLSAPAALAVSRESLALGPMEITGRGPEALRLSAALSGNPLTGPVDLRWNSLDLARANAWIDRDILAGVCSGSLQATLLPFNRIDLAGETTLTGTLQTQGQTVEIRQGKMTLNAGRRGVRLDMNIEPSEGGSLSGAFVSSGPAERSIPETGEWNLRWRELDLKRFSAALPRRTRLEGKISGEMNGTLLPDRRFSLSGRAGLDGSKINRRGQRGDVSIDLRRASIHWLWQKDYLECELHVTMADLGALQGKIRLPLAAHFPLVMNEQGNLQGSLMGQVQEKGALGVLFPGLVQESRGNLDLDMKMRGSPADPLFEGRVRLSKAGGYLPSAGITLQDVRIDARLAKDGVTIDSFRAVSGPGYLDGTARIRLKGFKIADFEGNLNGDRFQAIHVPELHVQTSPRLTFSGTPEKISVRGEVLLPLLRVNGSQSQGPVESSPDLVREGKTKSGTGKPSVGLDVQVKLVLGEQAEFNAAGIDAKLGGEMEIRFSDPERISGRGEIRVVKGRFRTYGVNLEIVRGHLFYAGGPVNQPALDILAIRKIGEVKAGVAVSGKLPKPLVKLYSEPYMQDMDILAYIVLGHPLGADSKQAGLLATAAGAVLTSQQAEDLLEQIQAYLGLASLEISSDVLEKSNQMGYKRLKVTPEGTGSSSPGASETILVVGKYLTPELYISYGRSLFSGGNLFFLRYDLSKNWQVESQMGQESGIDLYYKLEFH
jgi:translocation and assembly module TamB